MRYVSIWALRARVDDAGRSIELGQILFEELLPIDLKQELPRTDNLVLQVDARTADVPWELLGDRLVGDRPLACRSGLLRLQRRVEPAQLFAAVRPAARAPAFAELVRPPAAQARSR